MMTLEELRADWRTMIAALDRQIASIDAGMRMHSTGRDSNDFTKEWRARLVGWRGELEALQREGDSIA